MLCIKLVNYWDIYTEMHGQKTSKNANSLQLNESVRANDHSLWDSRNNMTDYSKNEMKF